MVLMRKNFQILQSDWSAIQNWIVFYCDDLDSLNCAFNTYLRFVSNQISFLFFLLADSFWGDLKINWVVSTACTRTQLTQEKGRA